MTSVSNRVGSFVIREVSPNLQVSDYVVKSVGMFAVGFTSCWVMFSFLPALLVGLVLASAPAYVRSRDIKAERKRWERDLVSVCDVLDLGSSGGLSAMGSVELVASRTDGPIGNEFKRVLELSRRGVSLAEALSSAKNSGYGVIDGLITTLTDSHLLGSGLSRGVIQLRGDTSNSMRLRAETTARKAPTRMLFPLAVCILPAFVLLTIVPMVVSEVGQLQGLFH